MGIVLRGELQRYLQDGCVDAVARISALANARRSLLLPLGLDRFERDALDLDGYERALRDAQAAQAGAEDVEPATTPEDSTGADDGPEDAA